MRLTGVLILFLLLSQPAYSRLDSTELNSEPFDLFTEEESASFIEYITDFFSAGIDLNRAVKEDFLELPGFDEETADKIITYRQTNGKFYSAGELYIIPEINKEIIRRYYSFFRVDSPASNKDKLHGHLSFRQENRTNQNLPISSPGNVLKQRVKSELRYGENLTARIITEKDPGELRFADHYTGFVSLKQTGAFRNITAGSYILQSPAGLLSGSPYYIPLGSQSLRFTHDLRVKGFSSSEENRYLLGGAAIFDLAGVTLVPFYSRNAYDGSYSSSAETYSLLDGGYHRSITERRLQDGLMVKNGGLSVSMNSENVFGGSLTFLHQNISSTSNGLTENFGAAALSARFDKYAVMSEIVFGRKLNYVLHAGRKAAGHSPVGIYFRQLNANTLPVYSNPYREGSYQNSETGGGIYFRLNPFSVPIDFIADIFSYRKPGETLTTNGFRILVSGEKKMTTSSLLRAGYSLRSKDKLISTDVNQRNSTAERHSFSVLLQQQFSPQLILKNRLIYNVYQNDVAVSSDGYAFLSELRFNQQDQYGVIAGYAGFSGKSIETASYFSERSFLDFGSLRPLIGSGNYLYTSLFAKLPLNFTLSAKAGWENKTGYDDSTDKNFSGSFMILFEW